MIKTTYEIKLTEEQFKALKEMVQQEYLRNCNCGSGAAELYDLFKVKRHTVPANTCSGQ